jgi:hypothetical protein
METGIVIPAISNMVAGALIIIFCIPLLMNKISMNQWYGIRFRKSFESTENWYKINKYGAGRMVLWSIDIIVISVAILFLPLHGNRTLRTILVFCIPLLIIIPVIESWLYARKLLSDE